MLMRPLGQSGIEASAVGFGAWAIGGWMWGGSEESEAVRAIHTAIDSGVNLIDTAAIYGFGLSEQIVGRAIADRRDRVVLATKCTMVIDPNVGEEKFNSTAAGPDPLGLIPVRIHAHPDSIRRECDASLQRLGIDHIDLYQTHWQTDTTPIADTMGALMELKQAGKIRAIGVSNATSKHMDEYRKLGPIDSDQEHYSMLRRHIEQDQLPYCHEHNIAVLAYSPLARGLLTGKVGPEREFGLGDHRREIEAFSVENRKRVQEFLDQIGPIAQDHGLTLAQLVIAWTVHQPGLTHALVGARNQKQAEENAAAGEAVLSQDELDAINQALAGADAAPI